MAPRWMMSSPLVLPTEICVTQYVPFGPVTLVTRWPSGRVMSSMVVSPGLVSCGTTGAARLFSSICCLVGIGGAAGAAGSLGGGESLRSSRSILPASRMAASIMSAADSRLGEVEGFDGVVAGAAEEVCFAATVVVLATGARLSITFAVSGGNTGASSCACACACSVAIESRACSNIGTAANLANELPAREKFVVINMQQSFYNNGIFPALRPLYKYSAQTRVNTKSQTPCPRRKPRFSNLVTGR